MAAQLFFGPWGDVLPRPLALRLRRSAELPGLRLRQGWETGSALASGWESGEGAVSAGLKGGHVIAGVTAELPGAAAGLIE